MKVGFRKGLLYDRSRSDWDGSGPRPLSWKAWYPASETTVEADFNQCRSDDAWFNIGQVAHDAPLSSNQQSFPTVLLSHGTGGTALSLAWLAQELARRGFAAIAVDHHGNTANEPYRAEGFLCWWERARDLTVLLDDLAQKGEFAGRLDLGRVYGAGFSLGGHTVMALLGAITEVSRFETWGAGRTLGRGPMEFPDLDTETDGLMGRNPVFRASWERQSASYRDSRIKAALLCAPAPPIRGLTEESVSLIDTPVAIFVGGADKEAPADECASWLQKRLTTSRLTILGQDVGHFAFLPEATALGKAAAPHLCVDMPGVNRGALHDIVTEAAVELFQVGF